MPCLCGFSRRGQVGVACQTSAQRHGRHGDEGPAEPHHEQQQAPVPFCSHRGRPASQPAEHQDAKCAQLQGWRKGLSPVRKQREITQLCFKMINVFSFFKDCHTEGIWHGAGQVRPLQ